MEDYTLKSWINEWLVTYKKPYVSASTYSDINRYAKHIKYSDIGAIHLASLTAVDIQKYLNKIPKSRKKELISIYLNACLEKAHVLEIIPRNPFKAVTKDKKINNVRISLNLEQQKAFLKAIKGTSMEELGLFYLLTGVRLKEALTVRFADIYEKDKYIHISGTKTRNSIRNIPLSKKYIKHLLSLNTDNRSLIFNFSSGYVSHKIHSIFQSLEIPACTHCLRHTFSTNQMYLGTPDKFRQEWLGHATLTMTNNVYTHLDKSLNKRNILRLYNKYYYYERIK